MVIISTVLLALAVVLFFLAATKMPQPFPFVAVGLGLWSLSQLLGSLVILR